MGSSMKSVVTGGAGFIGSHLVDTLVAEGDEVTVIDNLSTGKYAHIKELVDSGSIGLVRKDLLLEGWQDSFDGVSRVFHLAADPDVRASSVSPEQVYRENVTATMRVLEAMRHSGVRDLVFTSTSTVYGEASVIPTPEEYTPMEPISVYGGTKLACEAMISSYAHTYGMKTWVFRFANIIGSRSNHGVIWDFLHKLRENPGELEILGDGRQSKSYLSVDACIDALLYAVTHSDLPFNVFNIGSEDWIDVRSIARILVDEMRLSGVKFRYTGGDRGWKGDVPRMLLSVDKLKSLGWRPLTSSEESVRKAARELIGDIFGEEQGGA
jgi:UDP-glucose 4-epimerase